MSSADADVEAVMAPELRQLLESVYVRYQHDFRDYAPAMLQRRVGLLVNSLGLDGVAQLEDQIIADPAVFDRLLRQLTIQVSDMFRDPQYYAAVRQLVVPTLKTFPSVKVWVAGCSTGEELWSLAILFHEEGLLERTRFYATDISASALRTAESGIYPIERVAAFSRNYLAAGGRASLSDYYVAAYGAASFARSLPVRAVFADHSLATDSVFSEVHFASCRNVLIYFGRSLQDRAIGLFRDSLVRNGFLGLGSHESLRFSTHGQAFETIAARERLYRRH
ncbi:MAG TPA: CheR family methyltransferase [Fontimonas sp.]